DNSALFAFIFQLSPSWFQTQTVPPQNVTVRALTDTSIEIRWEPINFFEEDGFFEVALSTSEDGDYEVVGQTSSKLITSLTIENLEADQVYFAKVRTYTFEHGDQRNILISDYSEPSS